MRNTLDRPLLGVRSWDYEPEEDRFTSVLMSDTWEPDFDMVARGCERNEVKKSRVTEVKVFSMTHHYLRLARERERMGFQKSAKRLRSKAMASENDLAWPIVYQPLEFEEEIVSVREALDAPGRNCSCGLYAYYDFLDARDKRGNIPTLWHPYRAAGLVAAWGPIVLHDYGFRAKFMRIVAFLFEKPSDGFEEHRIKREHQAKLYGVPMIKPSEIEAFAAVEGLQILQPKESGKM